MRTNHEVIIRGTERAIRNVSKVLNRKITIQKLTTVTSPNGFDEEKWVDWETLWASKNNLSGKEYYSAKTVNEEKTVKFEVRYFPKLEEINSTEYRIIHEGKEYNITFIDNFMYRNEWLVIKALEVN